MYKIGIFVFAILLVACTSLKAQNQLTPLSPEQYRRPWNYKPEKYQYSLNELKDRFSEEMMKKSAEVYERVQTVNEQGKWKPVPESIDLHKAPEWFLDAKFGMFIDWGLWSIAGWAPKKEKGAMYPDWYELRLETDSAFMAYHEKNWGKDFKRDDFIPLFQARKFQPEKLISTAKKAGMKYIVPFCKHHSGYCLWPSSFTLRDAGDMGPKRDLIKPLVENCRKEGLKFGFYFSVEEWEYPVIDDNQNLQNRTWGGKIEPYHAANEKKCTGKIAVKDFATDYLVPQAVEFIDNYDPDLIWYDGDWKTNVDMLRTYNIAAYFYNKAEGRKQVAINDRYGPNAGEKWQRSKRGDFFTNEYGDMEKEVKESIHAWEECRGISQSFGFNWQDTDENVISSKAFIDMFVDIVAHGGNLLLIVNLDGQGALPGVQEKRLMDIGKWLSVNGEGIYATRPYKQQSEGSVSYTQSKDGKYIYAILKEWPGNEMILNAVSFKNTGSAELLGFKKPLRWQKAGEGIRVQFPGQLNDEKNRPSGYASVLKFSVKE
jgi:alpha-L-fucosidase